MSKDKREGSYRSKGKTPFVYSATYQMWRKAFLSGNRDEAQAMTCHHMKQFGDVKSDYYLCNCAAAV